VVGRVLRAPAVRWIALLLVPVLAFALYWFQPWKLFTTKQVSEAVPVVATPSETPASAPIPAPASASASPANLLLARGSFVTHEHDTSGTVQVVRLADGRRQLVLLDLATSDGPDLRVWLTDQKVLPGTAGWRVFDDGKYVELGRLKGNQGNQVYEVPADVDLAAYRSVSIWCKRFAVSFGAAELSAG